MSQLKPTYVSVNTTNRGHTAFIAIGMDASGQVWALNEYHEKSSLPYPRAFKELVSWLRETWKKYPKKVPRRGEKYLLPDYLYFISNSFFRYYWENKRDETYLKTNFKNTEQEPGARRIQTLLEDGNLTIQDCPDLESELKKVNSEDFGGDFPVHRALANITNILAMTKYWKSIGESRGGGKSKDHF